MRFPRPRVVFLLTIYLIGFTCLHVSSAPLPHVARSILDTSEEVETHLLGLQQSEDTLWRVHIAGEKNVAHLEECAGILQPLLYLSGNIWLVSTTEGLKAGDLERQCPIVLQADPMLHGHKLSQQLGEIFHPRYSRSLEVPVEVAVIARKRNPLIAACTCTECYEGRHACCHCVASGSVIM